MHEEQNHEPQRLSALYQYHNAPEVAPAHGLEYDDTNYPSSDKYPVIATTPYQGAEYTGKNAYRDNRPPRIIFGMKIRTFLCVAAVMVLIAIGAAVGGAVGGRSMRENEPTSEPLSSAQNATTTSMTSSSANPTTASQYSAPTPTYTPLNDCPDSNNTLYTSTIGSSSSASEDDQSSSRGPTADLRNQTFTKYCDLFYPITATLTEAFVFSFSDCIDICAGLNFWQDAQCTVATYRVDEERPSNCFVSTTNGTDAAALEGLTNMAGSAVALLNSP